MVAHNTHSIAFALCACEQTDRQSRLVGVTVARNDMAFLLPHTAMCWMCITHAEAEIREQKLRIGKETSAVIWFL